MTTTLGSFTPGVLEILSIGKGDIKLSIDNNDEDREKARVLIEEMLRKGYALFVETDDGAVRVTEFNPKRMTYTIMAPALPAPPERKALPPGEPTPAKATRRQRQRGHREIPVSGSKTTAVGRTAGG